MRLTFDLRSYAAPVPQTAEERVVSTGELASMARTPAALARLLWGCRWDDVRVLEDPPPHSGLQAGARTLAALARAGAIRNGEVAAARGRYALRAAARAGVAVPAEVAATVRLPRAAARYASEPVVLPAPRGRPRSLTYLRSEPSLRWMGLHVGGAATHTSGVINGLVANGVDVEVFAPEAPAGVDPQLCTPVAPQALYQLAYWLTVFAYSEVQVEAAQHRRVDAVYQRYALGSYAGQELARRLDVPLILEFNGSELWAHRHWGSGRVAMEDTLAELERRTVLDASLVVVVSEPLRDQLLEGGVAPERILVNPNGVDVERLAGARARTSAQWRRELGRPEAPTIGFIGTFGLWHGVKLLPELVGAVARTHPDARWHLVGDGPLHAEVRDGIERRGLADRVVLSGLVPHGEATKLLAACDVCVSPHVPNPDGTPFFGSPTKLFEYMGLAKPIVASDLDQIGEVLDHERSALLVPPADVRATAAAVGRLLDDAPLRERLAAEAFRDAEERFSWTAHVRRILDAVEALAQR